MNFPSSIDFFVEGTQLSTGCCHNHTKAHLHLPGLILCPSSSLTQADEHPVPLVPSPQDPPAPAPHRGSRSLIIICFSYRDVSGIQTILLLGAIHTLTSPAARLHLRYHFMLFLCTEHLPPWLPSPSTGCSRQRTTAQGLHSIPSSQGPHSTTAFTSSASFLTHSAGPCCPIQLCNCPIQVLSTPPVSSGTSLLLTITPPSDRQSWCCPAIRLSQPLPSPSSHQKNPAITADHTKYCSRLHSQVLPLCNPCRASPLPSTSKPC